MHSLTRATGLFLIAAVAVTFLAASKDRAAAATAATAPVACGSVDLGSSGTAAAPAFNCFTKAYAHCDLATLSATTSANGDPVTSEFTIYPGDSGCLISEIVSGPAAGDGALDSYVCTAVSQDGDALHFTGCGTQRDVWLRPANG
jgi:hypothetical protein